MDRAEATGFGVAVAGHGALLAALALGLATAQLPPLQRDAIEVSFVDEVALESSAPRPAPAARAPSRAEPTVEPAPAPPAAALSTPSTLAPPRTPAPPKQTTTTRTADRLKNILSNVSDSSSDSSSADPPAAVMSAQAAASIGALIRRQVQPCADRMVNPGPGASRIKVRINLKLNRNGSLRAPPSVEGVSGLDGENRRYAQRVKELAIAAFTSCSPLRGLPPELYAVSNGWSDFDMNYNLP
jgi:hypothetical protein